MKISAPSPPQPQPLPPDPAMEAVKKQAEEDKASALQERVSARTNDLLLRYGGRAAFGSRLGRAA